MYTNLKANSENTSPSAIHTSSYIPRNFSISKQKWFLTSARKAPKIKKLPLFSWCLKFLHSNCSS